MTDRVDAAITRHGLPSGAAEALAHFADVARPSPLDAVEALVGANPSADADALRRAAWELRAAAALDVVGVVDPVGEAIRLCDPATDLADALTRVHKAATDLRAAAVVARAVVCVRDGGFEDVLRQLRALREAKPSGPLDHPGLGLVAALTDDLPARPLDKHLLTAKNLRDNSFKEPRFHHPPITLVIEGDTRFDRASVGATGPQMAKMSVRYEAGPDVILIMRAIDGGSLTLVQAYALAEDDVAEAILDGARAQWPDLAEEAFERVYERAAHPGPWLLHGEVAPPATGGGLIYAVPAGARVRGVAVGDAVIVVRDVDGRQEATGAGRVGAVATRDGDVVIELDRYVEHVEPIVLREDRV